MEVVSGMVAGDVRMREAGMIEALAVAVVPVPGLGVLVLVLVLRAAVAAETERTHTRRGWTTRRSVVSRAHKKGNSGWERGGRERGDTLWVAPILRSTERDAVRRRWCLPRGHYHRGHHRGSNSLWLGAQCLQ